MWRIVIIIGDPASLAPTSPPYQQCLALGAAQSTFVVLN